MMGGDDWDLDTPEDYGAFGEPEGLVGCLWIVVLFGLLLVLAVPDLQAAFIGSGVVH